MASADCSICQQAATKYKCSTCKSPTCSLQCYKAHNLTHTNTLTASSEKPSFTTATTPTAPRAHPAPPPQASEPQPSAWTSPSTLASSSELSQLFTTHPALKAQLARIHSAVRDFQTSDPRSQSHSSHRGGARGRGRGRGGHQRRTPWQRPDDLEAGLRTLRAELEHGLGAAGMVRFFELVVARSAARPTLATGGTSVDPRELVADERELNR